VSGESVECPKCGRVWPSEMNFCECGAMLPSFDAGEVEELHRGFGKCP